MDFNTGGELADGTEVLDDAGFTVAEAAIEGEQLGPHAQHCNVHGLAALSAKLFFSRLDHEVAETLALMRGVDGELAEIAALAVHLSGDAGEKLAGAVFRQEDGALLHCVCNALLVGAAAFEKRLD